MDTLLLLARLVCAAVFAVAAIAKLMDLPGSRQAMRDFGVPAPLAPIAGAALPLLELLVAVALVLPETARWGALAALVLLAAFVAGIVRALRRGEQPDCHCFGQMQSAPAGRATVARNVGLAALAGLVLVAGSGEAGAAATAWIGRLDATQAVGVGVAVALAIAVAVLARLDVVLLAQNGRLLERVERLEQGAGGRSAPAPGGLPVGAAAPLFDLPSAAGGRMTFDALRARGKPLLLVFSEPGCGACRVLAPDLAAWHRDHADRVTLAVLTRGAALDDGPDDGPVALLRAGPLAAAYGVSATPSAVLVDTDGRVASPPATGVTDVRALLADALEAPAPTVLSRHEPRGAAPSAPRGPSVGDAAPLGAGAAR